MAETLWSQNLNLSVFYPAPNLLFDRVQTTFTGWSARKGAGKDKGENLHGLECWEGVWRQLPATLTCKRESLRKKESGSVQTGRVHFQVTVCGVMFCPFSRHQGRITSPNAFKTRLKFEPTSKHSCQEIAFSVTRQACTCKCPDMVGEKCQEITVVCPFPSPWGLFFSP